MLKWSRLQQFFMRDKVLIIVYVLVTIVASVQLTLIKKADGYTDYNNYIIFKQSFYHLLSNKNLYIFYLTEQWDLFKYSPSFALFFGLFSWLPNVIGLIAWNLLNAMLLFYAIRKLPLDKTKQNLMLWVVFVEMLTSLQNAQSNALLAGLMILAFALMESGKLLQATLCLAIAAFIKPYGLVGFALFLFYPGKIKFILYSALWMILLAALPLVVTPFHSLIWQYGNWVKMMGEDQAVSYGLSVMGVLHAWFGAEKGKNFVMVLGVLFFFLPFLRWKMYKDKIYRMLTLAAILVWVIIFNHKAESPTFVIAVCGAAIWFVSGTASVWRIILLCCVIVFTSLSVTDLFPRIVKTTFFDPYVVKAVPCILLWAWMQYELLLYGKNQTVQDLVC